MVRTAEAEDKREAFRRRLTHPVWIRAFFAAELPLALVAGISVRALDAEHCAVSVPYRFATKNPFRSTYFGALAMAAEISTGLPGAWATRTAGAPIAQLMIGMTGSFEKKAVSISTFTTRDVAQIMAAVAETEKNGAPVTVLARTEGLDPSGVVLARFEFTWSFKRRG